jgi:hypothetical protein
MRLLKACLIALAVLPLTAVAQSQTKLTVDDFTIKAGETKTLTVNLENPDMTVTLVQFDLELSEGLSVAKDEDEEYLMDIVTSRTTLKKHSLDYNDKNGRILLSSSSNKTLSGTSGAIITIDITAAPTFETGTITLKNIEIVSPDNTAENPVFSKPDNVVITIGTSGITSMTMNNEYQGNVYTLQGVKVAENATSLDNLEKGIYIINGRKVVKK